MKKKVQHCICNGEGENFVEKENHRKYKWKVRQRKTIREDHGNLIQLHNRKSTEPIENVKD